MERMELKVGDQVIVWGVWWSQQNEKVGKVVAVENNEVLLRIGDDLECHRFYQTQVRKVERIPWSELTLAKAERLAKEGRIVVLDSDTQTALLVSV